MRAGGLLREPDGAHPEGGRRADLRRAGDGSIRGVFAPDAVLHRAGAALHRAEHLLHPCAEGDLRRHPLPDAQDAARRRPVGDDALAHGACGLCPAAQDAGEQPADGLPTAEGAAN